MHHSTELILGHHNIYRYRFLFTTRHYSHFASIPRKHIHLVINFILERLGYHGVVRAEANVATGISFSLALV